HHVSFVASNAQQDRYTKKGTPSPAFPLNRQKHIPIISAFGKKSMCSAVFLLFQPYRFVNRDRDENTVSRRTQPAGVSYGRHHFLFFLCWNNDHHKFLFILHGNTQVLAGSLRTSSSSFHDGS